MTRRRASQRAGLRAGLRAGFTLVSVIIAMLLLVVGIGALARTQSFAIRSQRNDIGRAQALALASAYLEELRSRDVASLASEAEVAIDSVGTANAQGHFRRRVQVSNDATNLLRIQVHVTPPGSSSPVTLLTLFYKKTL